MPIYSYKCLCGYEADHVGKVDDKTMPCPECLGTMRRQFHSRFGISMGVGAYGYFDENLGTYVRTNAHKREVMRQQGVTEKIGKGWY